MDEVSSSSKDENIGDQMQVIANGITSLLQAVNKSKHSNKDDSSNRNNETKDKTKDKTKDASNNDTKDASNNDTKDASKDAATNDFLASMLFEAVKYAGKEAFSKAGGAKKSKRSNDFMDGFMKLAMGDLYPYRYQTTTSAEKTSSSTEKTTNEEKTSSAEKISSAEKTTTSAEKTTTSAEKTASSQNKQLGNCLSFSITTAIDNEQPSQEKADSVTKQPVKLFKPTRRSVVDDSQPEQDDDNNHYKLPDVKLPIHTPTTNFLQVNTPALNFLQVLTRQLQSLNTIKDQRYRMIVFVRIVQSMLDYTLNEHQQLGSLDDVDDLQSRFDDNFMELINYLQVEK